MTTATSPKEGTTMAIRTRTGRTLTRLAHIIVVGVLVAACSGASGGSGGIKVSDAWSRPSAMVAGAGAAYMIIENTGSVADALVGGSSPVAATVEVHETYAVEEMPPASGMPAESQGMGGSGMMGMRRIDTLDVPAGGTVELKPGGYHIMLIGLTRELVVGERIEITLTFEEAGDIKVTAEVRGQ
jgi:copper(I)-binding protein